MSFNADKCYKNPDQLRRAQNSVLGYHNVGKPRLQAALAMLEATEDIDRRMEDFEHPVLILHGDADVVTSPKSSQMLHDRCGSDDKTIILYKDCWHDMLFGETDEQRDEIYADIEAWLNCHSRQ